MLPIASTETLQPASRAQRQKSSRPSRSTSVSVRRRTPPLGVAPIRASSISERHRRPPSTLCGVGDNLLFLLAEPLDGERHHIAGLEEHGIGLDAEAYARRRARADDVA